MRKIIQFLCCRRCLSCRCQPRRRAILSARRSVRLMAMQGNGFGEVRGASGPDRQRRAADRPARPPRRDSRPQRRPAACSEANKIDRRLRDKARGNGLDPREAGDIQLRASQRLEQRVQCRP